VNSLDELFGEALDRKAVPTTQERRSAVAEVTVRSARRRRRLRAGGQAFAVVAVIGLAAAAGVLVLGSRDAGPTNPAPTTGTTKAPIEELKADPRMPAAPQMTADDWASQDGAWDAEFASVQNTAGAGSSTAVALYLTAPGGTRELAFATPSFPMRAPVMLAFDSTTRGLLVFDRDTKTLASVDVMTGDQTPINWQLNGTLSDAWPLGRALGGGDGYFVLETADSDGNLADSVFDLKNGVGTGVELPGWSPSPVWVMDVVTHTDAGLALGVVFADDLTTFDGTTGCTFRNWNTDGTFDVVCDVTNDSDGSVINVSPGTGDVTPAADADAPVVNAIDRTRTWTGAGTSGVKLTPPTVDNGDGTTVDLGDGFVSTPDSYSVIFGVR
jgi:hypothetical protein